MEVEIFTVCDFVQDNNGKLTIVGTFDRMNPPQYPHVHPNLGVALRLRFAQSEEGAHTATVRLTDQQNAELFAINGDLNVIVPPGEDLSAINMGININQVNFQTTGVYALQLFVDGEWKTGLKIRLG